VLYAEPQRGKLSLIYIKYQNSTSRPISLKSSKLITLLLTYIHALLQLPAAAVLFAATCICSTLVEARTYRGIDGLSHIDPYIHAFSLYAMCRSIIVVLVHGFLVLLPRNRESCNTHGLILANACFHASM